MEVRKTSPVVMIAQTIRAWSPLANATATDLGRFARSERGQPVALSLFKRYGNGGDNLKLKNWATATLPALQHHLDMAQGLYKNT